MYLLPSIRLQDRSVRSRVLFFFQSRKSTFLDLPSYLPDPVLLPAVCFDFSLKGTRPKTKQAARALLDACRGKRGPFPPAIPLQGMAGVRPKLAGKHLSHLLPLRRPWLFPLSLLLPALGHSRSPGRRRPPSKCAGFPRRRADSREAGGNRQWRWAAEAWSPRLEQRSWRGRIRATGRGGSRSGEPLTWPRQVEARVTPGGGSRSCRWRQGGKGERRARWSGAARRPPFPGCGGGGLCAHLPAPSQFRTAGLLLCRVSHRSCC